MIAALLMAISITLPPKPPIEPPIEPCEVYQAQQRYELIENEGLVRIKISCYIAPQGAHTADGSVPIEGYCSGNKEHIGQDLILYDNDLNPVGRYEIRDVGGHPLLMNGGAIDFYRDSLSRCYDFVAEHGTYAYIKYVDRNEGKDEETVSGNLLE